MPEDQERGEIELQQVRDQIEARTMKEINVEIHTYLSSISRKLAGFHVDYLHPNPDGSFTLKQNKEYRMLTDEGINHLITNLEIIVSPYVAMTNISDDEVKDITLIVKQAILNFIKINHRRYRIRSDKWETILHIATLSALFMLKRAKNAGERNFYRTTQRSYEQVMVAPQQYPQGSQGQAAQQKKGFFARMFRT